MTEKTGEIVFRAYIDNNTYQVLPAGEETDALNTRFRVALPTQSVYEARPTAYLTATNARPSTIWDTVYLRSDRPMRLTYVPGSAKISRRFEANGAVRDSLLDEDLFSKAGVALGRWRADFAYSGYVTFRVRPVFVPEPVRDPRLTRGVDERIVYAAPSRGGPNREPVLDGTTRGQFVCEPERCSGAPYVTLNSYANHPLLGDELDFVRATVGPSYATDGREIYRSVALVRPGDRLGIRITIDNSADQSAIGAPTADELVATNVRVRVLLPSGSSNDKTIVGSVSSNVADPPAISDSLPVRSTEPMMLRYVPNTAALLDSSGLHAIHPRSLFAASHGSQQAGIAVGHIRPSFSRVAYVLFSVDVRPAA